MLSLAQFLVVLHQAVMNVAIGQLVEDFDTSVTTIQGVITFYPLVMATLMITGDKIGDIIGRRRALVVGLVIYGFGSAPTAVSWKVPSLSLAGQCSKVSVPHWSFRSLLRCGPDHRRLLHHSAVLAMGIRG